MSDPSTSQQLSFFSDAGVEADRLQLFAVVGRERISALFEFELLLCTDDAIPLEDEELDALLQAACGVTFGGEEAVRLVHGRLRAIERAFDPAINREAYRCWLVPTLWNATLTRRSRVFQQQTVPEIVEAVLSEYVGSAELDINLRGTYMAREYVVQYEEDDWSFINRLMEHVGIFHWFTHDAEVAMLHVGDHNHATTQLQPDATYYYDTRQGRATDGRTARSSTRRRERGVRDVHLRDYNWRTPAVSIEGKASADTVAGTGFHYHYGDHVKDPDEAAAIATVRGEQLACLLDVHELVTNITALSPGHRFELADYPMPGATTEFLVLESHTEQRVGGQTHLPTHTRQNTVRCIPAETPFRPARVTPRPVVAGFVHAQIDGEVDGSAAPIDKSGRYKVLLPWDLVGVAGGSASRWIRMAQPHAGPGYGMHLPLHCGAEVLLAHLDGDVDRPIIIGSVPNEEHVSPVTDRNATQSIIRTRGDIVIRMDDDV
jgi:type VI secretion system secreted protein VgrG